MLLTCLLLLFTQFGVGTTTGTQCPTNCSCTGDTSLVVDCRGLSDFDLKQLSDQLDSLLSSKVTYGRLTSLSIINSPLTHVPRSVCRLTTLTELYLDHNRLSGLPDNCLTNLKNLDNLTVSDNSILTLQDGVFDGLRKLYRLDLRRNRIGSIGLSVFATSSHLSNLFYISLSQNNLTSLEPWFYDRGIIGSFVNKVRIDLTHNKITKFTNNMGFSVLKCSRKIPFVNVYLSDNNVHYFEDILNGWQLDIAGLVGCLRMYNSQLNTFIIMKRNNILCDCVNYNAYFIMNGWQNLPRHWKLVNCTLVDPVTKKSRSIIGYAEDLSLFVCEITERCPAGCICFRRPANATLHVYCSHKNITVLPLELPELPDSHTKYKLDFSHNQLLRRLEHRDYFVNTSILDVSDCSVDDVSDWEEIAKIPEVILSGNKITLLPRSCLSINTTGKLNLASNLWDCSCDNKWMSDCFSFIADRLTQKVLCHSPSRLNGKNIIQISDEEFCVDPTSEAASKAVRRALTISMSSVSSVIIVLLSIGVILYRMRVKLYTRWKIHPFDRDECLGEDMGYDVFLSCSTADNLAHGNGIRQQLEQRGYRVCYPPRDFLAGAPINENIYNAIVCSKRTVCLLSENFIDR